MCYMLNKYSNYLDLLYKECYYNNFELRKWIKVGEFVEIVIVIVIYINFY